MPTRINAEIPEGLPEAEMSPTGLPAEGNVVLKKFEKRKIREEKTKRWGQIEDAVSAARKAYEGSFDSDDKEEITVPFEKAVGDLIEILQKIISGEVALGGLGEETGLELPAEPIS